MSDVTTPTGMPATTPAFPVVFETLIVRQAGGVLFVEIASPPMNLLGPELVRDLVSLIQHAEADDAVRVLVFQSADPDYFISHVDLTRVTEYRAEAAKLTGEASIALLFRYLSASRLVTIAQIEGRVRAAGSEFILACDMRFAARESAIFCQFEPAFGQLPGGGAAQHLTRLMGRGRALEVMLSAEDYDAGGAIRLDQSRTAWQCAQRVRQVARSSDRSVSGCRLRGGQGPRQRDRPRVRRGFSSRLRSVRRGSARARHPEVDRDRAEAGIPDARRGTGSCPPARRANHTRAVVVPLSQARARVVTPADTPGCSLATFGAAGGNVSATRTFNKGGRQ
jgi:enoyl-CoA hydratase/carnithine racemase